MKGLSRRFWWLLGATCLGTALLCLAPGFRDSGLDFLTGNGAAGIPYYTGVMGALGALFLQGRTREPFLLAAGNLLVYLLMATILGGMHLFVAVISAPVLFGLLLLGPGLGGVVVGWVVRFLFVGVVQMLDTDRRGVGQ